MNKEKKTLEIVVILIVLIASSWGIYLYIRGKQDNDETEISEDYDLDNDGKLLRVELNDSVSIAPKTDDYDTLQWEDNKIQKNKKRNDNLNDKNYYDLINAADQTDEKNLLGDKGKNASTETCITNADSNDSRVKNKSIVHRINETQDKNHDFIKKTALNDLNLIETVKHHLNNSRVFKTIANVIYAKESSNSMVNKKTAYADNEIINNVHNSNVSTESKDEKANSMVKKVNNLADNIIYKEVVAVFAMILTLYWLFSIFS